MRRGPLRLLFVGAGAALVVGLATAALFWASTPETTPPAPLPSSIQPLPPRASTQTAPPAPRARAPEPSAKPPSAPESIESGPVTLIWKGKLRASTGAAPRPGNACTLTARVRSNGARASKDLVSFQCGGSVLYDSSLPLEGMSSSRFGVGEQPISGEVAQFDYVIEAQDVGTRSGPKAQLSANSKAGVVEVFRDTAPSFRVQAVIERSSQVRQGRPLFTDTVPPFTQVVTRQANVVSKSGRAPFSGSRCTLVISPAYAQGHTCRVTLRCQNKIVYGGAKQGFNHCLLDGNEPASFVDPNPTPASGDPQLQADLKTNTATLSDAQPNGSSYLVQFALTR